MLLCHEYALKHALTTFLLHMQIPNFMLAMPMLYISFAGCYEYFSQDWTRSVQLGLLPTYPSSALGMKLQSQKTKAPKHPHWMASEALCTQALQGFNSNDVAPYIHQWAVMTACALLVMNVQVATRYVTISVVTDAFSCSQDDHQRLNCDISPSWAKCD